MMRGDAVMDYVLLIMWLRLWPILTVGMLIMSWFGRKRARFFLCMGKVGWGYHESWFWLNKELLERKGVYWWGANFRCDNRFRLNNMVLIETCHAW